MYEDEIARGMIKLEQEFGEDFHTKIDLDSLNMGNCTQCVLGQMGAADHDGDYATTLELLSWHTPEAIEHGFEAPDGHRDSDGYGRLTNEWRRALAARSFLDVPGESAEELAGVDD